MRAAVTNNKMIRFPLLHIPASLSTPPLASSLFLPSRHWFHLSAGMQLWISWRIHLRQTFTVEQITASWGAAEILTACLGHTHIHRNTHVSHLCMEDIYRVIILC